MNAMDKLRTILKVEAMTGTRLKLTWSDGTTVEIPSGPFLARSAFAALRDAATFGQVKLGEWGQSLHWPGGVEIGADALWLETLSQRRQDNTRLFLEWRLRHGLSLSAAAEALGLSRRMVAYYSNGEKPVPRHILLACRGWESDLRKPMTRRRSSSEADLRRRPAS